MDEMNQVPNPPAYPQPLLALPNATSSLVLGIISIVSLCCCTFIGVVLGIIGLVQGNSAIALYKQSPGVYSEASYKNANAGKICSIIGLVLGALSIVSVLSLWVFKAAMLHEIIGQIKNVYGF